MIRDLFGGLLFWLCGFSLHVVVHPPGGERVHLRARLQGQGMRNASSASRCYGEKM